jgi:hypothetical protein
MLLGAVSGSLIARRGCYALALALCAGWTVCVPRAMGQAGTVQVEPEAELPARASAAVVVVRDDFSTPQQCAEAARELIGLSQDAAVLTVLREMLAERGTGAEQAVVDGFAGMAEAPVRLFPMVTQHLAAAGSPEEAARIIPALGAFRLRDTVRILGRYVGEGGPASVAAMRCLARVSARDDIPMEPAAWLRYAGEVQQLTDAQWRSRLIAALAARERRLEEGRQTAVGQLVETLRRLHLATRPEDRPGLLGSLLLNDTPEVRQLGFELVRRELSAGVQLDGPVGGASLRLLEHVNPGVRADAAVLVRQLAPEGAAEAVGAALVKETDAAAAEDLLLAAARWPTVGLTDAVLRWVEAPTPAREAAFEAAWWMDRAGQLTPEGRTRLLGAVRALTAEEMTPASVSLMAAVGGDEDRERLAPLLRSDVPAIRQATGEALVWYGEFGEDVLDAAAYDRDLFDLASRAVLVNGPTAERVRRLLMLPLPSADVAQPAILRTANGLEAGELLTVAVDVEDLVLRRAMLGLLVSADRVMSEGKNPAKLAAIAEGAALLADLELSEGQAEAALATLDAAPFADELVAGDRIAGLRCAALLGIGQVEVAEGLKAPVEGWLRGLELAKDGPQAGRIVQEVEARFRSSMTPEQRAYVDGVKQMVAEREAERKAAERPRPLPQ